MENNAGKGVENMVAAMKRAIEAEIPADVRLIREMQRKHRVRLMALRKAVDEREATGKPLSEEDEQELVNIRQSLIRSGIVDENMQLTRHYRTEG